MKQLTTTPQFQFDSPQQQQKQTALYLFPVGSEVEVSSDEEGFRGAWYLATVTNPPPPFSLSSKHQHQKVFVEYNNLLSDENGSCLLKEFVDLAFVRPKPPVDDEDEVSFEVNDVVDTFFQYVWWTGVVTEAVCNENNRRYRVFFSNPPDEMEFGPSDLRVHRNWVDSKCVLLEKQRMRELNFSPQTAVEVNIDPDNSCDVWFPATFIKQVSDNSFLVEYQSSREAGVQKVSVDSVHIRPAPPCSSSKAFNLLEKVDAFYDCRWLSGIVTKILADGRYIVYFKRTKKEKELCHIDLRLHMEWTNGKWVHSSQDYSTSSNSEKKLDHAVNGGYKEKICLPAGGTDIVKGNVGEETLSAVALKSCQKLLQTGGSENAVYDGTTPSNKRIKRASANGDYVNLKSSKQSNEKTASDVALSPEACKSKMKQTKASNNGTQEDLDTPSTPGKSTLKQSEDSDQPSASTDSKGGDEKLGSTEASNNCRFPFPKRPRLGTWGRPSRQTHLEISGSCCFPSPRPYGDAYLSQCYLDEKCPTTRKRGRPPKLRALVSDAVIETPNGIDMVPLLRSIVLGLTHNGKMIPSLPGSSGQRMKEEPKVKKSVENEEKHCDNSTDNASIGGEQQRDNEVTNLKRKRGRPPKVLFRVGSPKTKERELAESRDAVSDAKDTSERHSPTDEFEKPIAEVDKPISVVEPVRISDSVPSIDSPKKHVMIISDQFKHLSDIGKLNKRSTARRTLRKHRKISKEIVKDKDDINEPVRSIIIGRGRQQSHYRQSEPLTEDAVDDTRQRVAEVFDSGVAKDVEAVVTGTSSHVSDDDRPLSAWFDGAHSPASTDGRVLVTAGQCDTSGETQDQNKKQPPGQPKEKAQDKNNERERRDETPVESTAIVARNNEELPFVKNSLIWEMIESMEVFKRIPQNPHFRPLYNCKEECREGLAIGNMVTFTSLVERVSRLHFGDPKTLLDGYLEALIDLEELGFNVGPVRDQVNTLLAIKGRYEPAQNTSKEIESQIMERNHEKSKINEEIVELDNKIEELNEKRALAVSNREMKDAEIALLQSSVDAVKGCLEIALEEFEKVTASLW